MEEGKVTINDDSVEPDMEMSVVDEWLIPWLEE